MIPTDQSGFIHSPKSKYMIMFPFEIFNRIDKNIKDINKLPSYINSLYQLNIQNQDFNKCQCSRCKAKGNYEIKYSVEDSSGNKTEEIAKVHVTTKDENTYIEVKISTQKLVYYVKRKAVFTTDVTTGLNGATKLGNFRVNKKVKNTYLVTKKYKTFVKYWIGYDGRSYGIHAASWRKKFGGNIYLTNGSHGCVNVPTSSAEKLFSMVEVGTPVYIKR